MGVFGEKIEDYEILEHLGKGGFAHVYRAKCLRSGSFVAIKMIDKALMANAGMVGRVRQEVTIHSRLKHPAVLELFTFFEDAHYVYLVLELAHNGELAKHFRLGTRGLSEKAAVDIFKQVVSGVTYLHSHNILHRDLSLNNLLLTKEMRVKIADFGLATQLNAPDEKHVTMCGTPNYISPEVASRECHGLPADVWGLGCMLYTLLVGSPPFHTQHVKSTLNRVINADYKIPAEISPQTRDLLQQLLCRDPSKRISLRGILEHPFLNMSFDNASMGRQDLSRDSGFQTTLHSTQHTRPRSEDKSTASANADFLKYHRQNSLEQYVNKNDNRPSSFNVLTGIHDSPNVISCNSSIHSYGQPQQSSTHFSDKFALPLVSEKNHLSAANGYICNSTPIENKMYELNSVKLDNLHIRSNLDGQLKFENKENIPKCSTSNAHAASIGVPPLCADRLPSISHRTRNAILKIEPDAVIVEFIKKKGKDREDKLTEICKISRDGMKVAVYPVNGGKGRSLSSREVVSHEPTPDEVFTYHNLPQKHWKKYLYAARFVDLVKAKTPKVTLYSSKAKCQLMENGTDLELFFYEGEKVTFNQSDGLKIIDKNCKIHDNPTISPELKYIFDHYEECVNRCRKIETVLSSIPEECFPLIIGKRPAHYLNRGDHHQQGTPLSNCNTPVLNIGSFCQGTTAGSTRADSECNNAFVNHYASSQQHTERDFGQLPIRRLPLHPKTGCYN